ncbi:MAG: aldo/keto reductase [Cytophagaceae bacterium]|jgi:aryl-alcohol dehydrogenase-like predicted oxidoreductase|nr:aldo/keto reductase [Cytophagaceae bacterium]
MRYKLFGKTGLRVSELSLGTMTFGTEWGWGADYDESKKMFDLYCQAGGNFIDTANRYTEGTSEKWVGEFIASDRDHFVLASKYTLFDRKDANHAGNHRKNMVRSLEGSLQRLRTSHLDILWLHAWDFTTGEEEIMRALEDMVRSGKVLYLGISDTPAWLVSRCNTIAELRGWNAFAGLQVEYSLVQRTVERDLLPMARHLGMAITPWAPLGSGALTGKYLQNEAGRIKEGHAKLNEKNTAIAQKVVDIAKSHGYSPAQVALRWVMQQAGIMVPILGARKAEQMADNLQAIRMELSPDAMRELQTVSEIEPGFPHDFLRSENVRNIIYGEQQGNIDNHWRK